MQITAAIYLFMHKKDAIFQPAQLTIFRQDDRIDKIIFNPVYHL